MIGGLLRRWRRASASASAPTPTHTPAPDRLDAYAKERIDAQASVDIFEGAWSSALPSHLGLRAGSAPLFDDPRIHWLLGRLGGVGGWRVLELGPLEGGHSYMLQEAGAGQVVAIDACAMSYLKCLLVKDLCGLSHVHFRYGDFMTALDQETTHYDLILASGVLYHQKDPVACIARMAQRSDRIFLWTHYFADDMRGMIGRDMFQRVAQPTGAGFTCDQFRLRYDDYLPNTKYRGGVDDHVHWLRRDDIIACLRHHGLTQIEVAGDQREHPYAPNIALLAQRPALTGADLADGDDYRSALRHAAGPEPWCIDSVRCTDGRIEVAGWAMPPGGVTGRMGFRVDGVPVQKLTCGILREDVGAFYWFYPGAQHSGFHFVHALRADTDVPFKLEYVDLQSGSVIEPLHDFYIRPQDWRAAPAAPSTPPLDLIRRTHAGNNVAQYLVEGYSTYRGLLQILIATIGDAAVGDLRRIVDFGSGAGRLTRYLHDAGHQVVAVDIDPACVRWCSEHFPDVTGLQGSLRPPLPLQDGAVDAVFAVQVLLHLRWQDARAWLREWARWCAPGGISIVTVASALALTRCRISASHYREADKQDFVVLSRNPDLDGVIEEADYYQNVFYSHDFIRREWPRLGWNVLRIVPGAVANHYDAVILQRCPG